MDNKKVAKELAKLAKELVADAGEFRVFLVTLKSGDNGIGLSIGNETAKLDKIAALQLIKSIKRLLPNL